MLFSPLSATQPVTPNPLVACQPGARRTAEELPAMRWCRSRLCPRGVTEDWLRVLPDGLWHWASAVGGGRAGGGVCARDRPRGDARRAHLADHLQLRGGFALGPRGMRSALAFSLAFTVQRALVSQLASRRRSKPRPTRRATADRRRHATAALLRSSPESRPRSTTRLRGDEPRRHGGTAQHPHRQQESSPAAVSHGPATRRLALLLPELHTQATRRGPRMAEDGAVWARQRSNSRSCSQSGPRQCWAGAFRSFRVASREDYGCGRRGRPGRCGQTEGRQERFLQRDLVMTAFRRVWGPVWITRHQIGATWF
jgi:hypothetical protein